MAAVTPIATDAEELLSKADRPDLEAQRGFKISIRSCIILLILVILVATVVLTTVIWLSSFASTVDTLATTLDRQQFSYLISFTNQTLFQLIISSESVKRQISVNFSNFSDWSLTERSVFNMVKSEQMVHPGLLEAMKVFDINGLGTGFVTPKAIRPFYKTVNTLLGDYYYICNQTSEVIDCPTFKMKRPMFNASYAINAAKMNAGKPVFSKSFVSPPVNYTLLALVNTFVQTGSSNLFEWLLYMDFSTATFSNFLKSNTRDVVPGSIAFILEGPEKYIIACKFLLRCSLKEIASFPETSELNMEVTPWIRSTVYTFNNTAIQDVFKDVTFQIPDVSSITCNTITNIATAYRRVNVFRLCTQYQIDWIIVFSVPQWNSIGSMIIAIIIALLGNLIILAIGTGIGVFSALKIVKPFSNLIEMFELVSNMELDSLFIQPSSFKEVSVLQSHFIEMTNRVKQYRAFIPAHLLSQLDESNDQIIDAVEPSVKDHITDASSSRPVSSFHSSRRSSLSEKRSLMAGSLFKLGLQHKKITFTKVYFEGLDRLICQNQDITGFLSEFYRVLQHWGATAGCQIGNLENQFITLSWNSISDVKNHITKAVEQSRILLQRLEKQKDALKNQGKKPEWANMLNFRMAICSEMCVSGNVGTEKVKNFTIIGNYHQNLNKLIAHACKTGIKIIISETVKKECEQTSMLRFVGRKCVTDEEDTSFFGSIKKKKTNFYELGASLEVSMDEWMYELNEKEKKKSWQVYNEACEFYLKSNYRESIHYFRDYVSTHASDQVALYMIGKCERRLK